MKILVFSDSHGNFENMKLAINHFNDIKTVIHLGDFISDIKEIKLEFPYLEIYAVSGNNDFTNEPNETIINLGDNIAFLTHGNKYGVYYGINSLYYKGIENNANIILFGHTHCRFLEMTDEILILNPGSISKPRDSEIPSFAIIEIQEDEIFANFFGILKNEIIKIR